MELVYLWVEKYRNISKQGYHFSDTFKVDTSNGTLLNELSIEKREEKVSIFGDKVSNITAIIGKNGSGKTNILDLLGSNGKDRSGSDLDYAKYFILYHVKEDIFVVEGNYIELAGGLVNKNSHSYNKLENDISPNFYASTVKKEGISFISLYSSRNTYKDNLNYLQFRPNLNKFAKKHYEAVSKHFEHKKSGYTYDDINNWFLTTFKTSFKDIILADYDKLTAIKKEFKGKNPGKTNVFPKEIQHISNYLYSKLFADAKTGIGSEKYSAATLVESLGIKVCPYCNRNYINNISYSGKGVKRTCQIDHFYCKQKYPFLAISFYNLIPACSTCNHIKSNKDMGYSPYDNKENSNDLGQFNVKVNSVEFLTDTQHFNIVFSCSSEELKENKSLLLLEEQYNLHKDVVRDTMQKKYVYSDFKIKEMYDDFPSLFKTQEDVKYFIYGNTLQEKDFLQKPLSKLVENIYTHI